MVRFPAMLMSALAVALVAGCAAHPEPIVDLKGLDPEVFQADLEECRTYADRVDSGEAIVKGAAVGAVIGAAVGAISGNAGGGAGYGGIAGATESGQNAEYERRVVFARCLEGRGYRVLNSPPATYPYRGYVPGYPRMTPLPEVWTPTITSEL